MTLNLITPNNPFASSTFNDNMASLGGCVAQQQGSGVVKGMTLSSGGGLTLNIAAGWVQNNVTIPYGGGTATVASTTGTFYVMASWTGVVNPTTGLSAYTFTFATQSSPTPPSGKVCLGTVTVAAGAITSVGTAGLTVLAHQTGAQFIVGQNRLVSDESTGIVTVQNLQGNVAIKNVLVSGDNAVIDAGYQVLMFGSFTVPSGATFTCNGQMRVIS